MNRIRAIAILLMTLAALPCAADDGDGRGKGRELLTAIRANDLTAARRLLENNAGEINLSESYGEQVWEQPPMAAVDAGNLEMLKLLLAHGASPNLRYPSQTEGRDVSLVTLALRRGHPDIARYLLTVGADPVDLILHAMSADDPALFRYGLGFLKSADAMLPWGATLLMEACRRGLPEYVAALIKKGAKVNTVSRELEFAPMSEPYDPADAGGDALSAAILARSDQVVRLLFGSGAKPGVYALNAALMTGQARLAEELLDRGARPHRAALVFACEFCDAAVVARLLALGARPDTPYNRRLPLNLAVEKKDFETVRLLMRAGANPKLADDEGNTALDLVSGSMYRNEADHARMVQLLGVNAGGK